MNGKPGSFGAIEAQLFLSFKTALLLGVSAALPVLFTAATGYLSGQSGAVGVVGAALAAMGRVIYLRQADNS